MIAKFFIQSGGLHVLAPGSAFIAEVLIHNGDALGYFLNILLGPQWGIQ